MTKEIINKKIGERIKIARKNANLTLLELANKIGLSEGNVQRYESGNIANVSVSILEKFAIALNTTTADLMGWSGEYSHSSKPQLTSKDEREINEKIESILSDMDSETGLAAYGGTIDNQEEIDLIKSSLEHALRIAKVAAKEKFTPKKYKK